MVKKPGFHVVLIGGGFLLVIGGCVGVFVSLTTWSKSAGPDTTLELSTGFAFITGLFMVIVGILVAARRPRAE